MDLLDATLASMPDKSSCVYNTNTTTTQPVTTTTQPVTTTTQPVTQPPTTTTRPVTTTTQPVTSQQISQKELDQILDTINDESFSLFHLEAYAKPDGYHIRTNPKTDKKEMFVAGTRSRGDWAQNAWDEITGSNFNPWREAQQDMLSKAAILNDVQVIFGHSRGGALVADMKTKEGVKKVGLNAAMRLARNKNMLNINEGGDRKLPGKILGQFDQFIGETGLQNVTYDFSPWSPHKSWKVNP